MREVIVTADDFGLSRNINETILKCVDHGALNRVSVLANGLDVDHALVEIRKRPNLGVAAHLNLTEGRALSKPWDIPLLVNTDGVFRYAPAMLLCKTIFATPSLRRSFKEQITRELAAQIERVRSVDRPVSVDGHQHVHMVPLVFSALYHVRSHQPYESVRIPREILFPGTSLFGLIRHVGLNMLAKINRSRLQEHIPHPDFFVGAFMSGKLTLQNVTAALREIPPDAMSVEVGVHPGQAEKSELTEWSGEISWHYSPWRAREGVMLKELAFMQLVSDFKNQLQEKSGFLQIARFVISGGVSSTISLGLVYLLTDYAGFWYVRSAVIAYIVATTVSFLMQKFWTFSHHSLARAHAEIMLYALNSLLAIAFTTLALYALVEYMGLWYMAAQLIILIIIATWNFFVFRFFIFRHA